MNQEIANKLNAIGKKRILFTALIVAVVEQIFGSLTCGWLFNWIYSIEPIVAWRYVGGAVPGMDVMAVSFIGSFLLNAILVAVFIALYDSISYKGWKKGAKFGGIVWAVSILPGMFATYMWMNVASVYIVYMLFAGLASLLIRGAIIGAMCKK